jgi:hypothetical protein
MNHLGRTDRAAQVFHQQQRQMQMMQQQQQLQQHKAFLSTFTMQGQDFGSTFDRRHMHSLNANYLLKLQQSRIQMTSTPPHQPPPFRPQHQHQHPHPQQLQPRPTPLRPSQQGMQTQASLLPTVRPSM